MSEQPTPKTLTILLTGTPFGSQATHTALNLAEAALTKGYRVNLFPSADGVYSAGAGQKAVGLPKVGERLPSLVEKGLRVDLCGSCLQLRGLRNEAARIEGAQPSSLKNLFAMIAESRAFIALCR
ncbi:MAG: DsrE family protein [Actinobacteria bacterium]|nr:DsrE family protein [Actinomycetota bacterium]